jgi:membrane protein YdbS with pleckstrin-like domain
MADDDQADATEAPGISLSDAERTAGDTDAHPPSYTPVEHEAPEAPPVLVARYLMPSELTAGVKAFRQHWIVLALPGLAVVGGLLVAIIGNAWLYANHDASGLPVHTLWLAWLAGAAWGGWRYAEWRCWWFVITGTRLMVVRGLFKRTVTPLPLKRVRDMELKQSAAGRALGFGTIECESIATDHALHTVSNLPFTVQIWTEIWSLLLPGAARGVKFEGMAEDAW